MRIREEDIKERTGQRWSGELLSSPAHTRIWFLRGLFVLAVYIYINLVKFFQKNSNPF